MTDMEITVLQVVYLICGCFSVVSVVAAIGSIIEYHKTCKVIKRMITKEERDRRFK